MGKNLTSTKKGKLNLYSVFHLNLAYSSIAEKQFAAVIHRCYWPLLKIADRFGGVGIEASGYTIEQIATIDPDWISFLKKLIREEKCEFVGSGYAQIIGPLVPVEVNTRNLSIGNAVYKELLGVRPKVAYINEQAYSQGLLGHYIKAGYDAIMMEWNNPYRFHQEWQSDWRYAPQIVINDKKEKLKLLWNNSIAFQKFQRYAHGEISLPEYLAYLEEQRGGGARFFSWYGNDAEIFDFRPGRFATEAEIHTEGEWHRIENAFLAVSKNPAFALLLPSKVLKLGTSPHALRLENVEQPIPVKKQEKYNITRWALAGRNSLDANAKCFQIYKNLMSAKSQRLAAPLWKNLCFLWDSDFRTHIEKQKYLKFSKKLAKVLQASKRLVQKKLPQEVSGKPGSYSIQEQEKHITIETRQVKLVLNKQRGLTVESLVCKDVSPKSLLGTLYHGYYDDISLGADFYTGHTIIEIPGKPKVTDLVAVDARYPKKVSSTATVTIEATISLGKSRVKKSFIIHTTKPRVDIRYQFLLKEFAPASFRSGIMMFNPEAFDRKSLFYRCSNGGFPETYFLRDTESINIDPVSLLVSSRAALGNTEGCLEIGDAKKSIFIKTDMARVAALPMVIYIRTNDTYFLRTLFSLGEINETSALAKPQNEKRDFTISISLK